MNLPLLSIYSFYGEHGAAWIGTWLPLTILAVIIVFLFYNAVLLLARAFGMKEIEREAKSEMFQAAATALIAIFLIVLVDGVMTFAGNLIYGELSCGGGPMTIDSLDNAIEAIRICRIQEKAAQIADVQKTLTTGSETWGLFTLLNLDISVIGLTIFKGGWLSNVYQDAESRRIINNLATTLLVSLNAQSFLLLYIKANMLNIFLPLGLLLRSFKFTRGVGALFMSVAIGLYFIFPVVFVLLDPGFVAMPLPESPPPTPQQYCYPTMSFATTIFSTMQTSGAATGMSALSMANLASDLSKTYVSLIIHPLVSLFITLVFIRYIASVLGGDTYELVKMVTKVI
ncbi:hypothetical protein H0O02_04435 [Candidatus Micrarchaeota archaeon]|nr:hypothetical protein [Candidatus Micrarchaeota archaeon]